MEIATLYKQKTVARVGQKHYNLQCKQPHYYQYFTSKGLSYTRDIVFSLIFTKINKKNNTQK